MTKRLLLAWALWLAPTACRADGMILWAGHGGSGWSYAPEAEQEAVLRLEGGRQHMRLRVRVDEPKDQAFVWVFPVPADPASVEIDVERKFASLYGSSIESSFRSYFSRLAEAAVFAHPGALAARVWPFVLNPMYLMPFFSLGELASDDGGGTSSRPAPRQPDVVVHKRVEKRGLAVEVLSARTAAGLSRYLKEKGVDPGPVGTSVLARYIGKEYCFIASWAGGGLASDPSLALSASFPAASLFFPLIPSSVYGAHRLPVKVQAQGLMTPRPLAGAKVEYVSGRDGLFTEIRLDGPASSLTEDLWIDPAVPAKPARQARWLAVLESRWGKALLPVILLLTLGAVGWALFPERRDRRGLRDLALLGAAAHYAPPLAMLVLACLPTRAAPLPLTTTIRDFWLRALDRRKLTFMAVWGALFLLAIQLGIRAAGVPELDARSLPELMTMGRAQNLFAAVILAWCQIPAYLAMSGARDGADRLRRWNDSWWTTGVAAVLMVLGPRGIYRDYFATFEAQLPFLTQVSMDAWGVFLAFPAFIFGLMLGPFLLLPAVSLSCLRVGELAKAAGVGALWGLFFSWWPYDSNSLAGAAAGAGLGFVLAAWRRSWDPREGGSFLRGTYWRTSLLSFALLALAFGLFHARRIPQPGWPAERLVEALTGDDVVASSAAHDAVLKLSASGRAAVLPRLLAAAREENPRDQHPAHILLHQLARIDGGAAQAALKEAAGSGPWQRHAIWALAGSTDPGVIAVLAEHVRSGTRAARSSSAQALLQLPRAEIDRIDKISRFDTALAEELRAAARRRRWAELERLGAASALLDASQLPGMEGHLRPARLLEVSGNAPTAIASLERILQSGSRNRWDAALALGRERVLPHRDALVRDLGSRDPARRISALGILDWLAGRDASQIEPHAVRMLGDPAPGVQEASAAILARRKTIEIAAITKNLKAGDSRARSAAMRALRQLGASGAPTIFDDLARILKTDHDEGNRDDAARMLGMSRRAAAIPLLIACLEEQARSRVRSRCADALGSFGAAAAPAVPALTKAAESDPELVRIVRAALVGIGTPGAKAAREKLKARD